MPRAARVKGKTGIYHVLLCEVSKKELFHDEEDAQKYLDCLLKAKESTGTIVYAYCLLPDRVHLLIAEGDEGLESFFKRSGVRFVQWYNRKYQRGGPLFRDRFQSEPVEDRHQFLSALRFIYKKPVQERFCEKVDEYRWSSYVDFGENALTDEDEILSVVAEEELDAFVRKQAKDKFIDLEPLKPNDNMLRARLEELGAGTPEKLAQMPTRERERLLAKLQEEGCSLRQIARVTGVSKAVVERIVRNDKRIRDVRGRLFGYINSAAQNAQNAQNAQKK